MTNIFFSILMLGEFLTQTGFLFCLYLNRLRDWLSIDRFYKLRIFLFLTHVMIRYKVFYMGNIEKSLQLIQYDFISWS